MSGTQTEDDPEVQRIGLKMSKSFLNVVDETWKERGFNNRSEFIRYALRETIKHPEGAGVWKDIAESQKQSREGDVYSREEVLEELE
ncbi:MAG: ribbon-helix-helix domain-containing protein [Halobacteria archaeon]